ESNWTSPIGFASGLTPSLGGTLDVEIANGIDPKTLLGDTFQLFNWNGPLPANDRFSSIIKGGGLNWDLSKLYTNGTVSIMPPGYPGANLTGADLSNSDLTGYDLTKTNLTNANLSNSI